MSITNQQSLYKKLFFICTLTFLLFLLPQNIKAAVIATESQKETSLLIMLDRTPSEEVLNTVKLHYPNVKFNILEEIDTVKAEGILEHEVINFKQDVTEYFNIETEAVVNDVDINIPTVETFLTSSSSVSNDIKYEDWLWDIRLVTNNFESYALNTGSHKIKVGIIDSGIDFNHPDLQDNILSEGHSFVPEDPSTQDTLGHGTMVAGIIAGNGKMKGIAPNLGLVPYRIFDANGAKSSWVIEAIIQATNDGMDVVNLSLSTFKSLKNKEDRNIIKAYEKAFKYAKKHNTTLVVSAGNEGLDISNKKRLAEQLGKPDDLILHLPGGSKDVITVAATTKYNTLASYSNFGDNISIVAPGGSYEIDYTNNTMDLSALTLTTYPTNLPKTPLSNYLGLDNGYELTIGTSVATPKVTAVVALIKAEYENQYGKEITAKKLEKQLYSSTLKFEEYDQQTMGSGIVNAYQALINIKK